MEELSNGFVSVNVLRNVLEAGARLKFEGHKMLLLFRQEMATAALNAETTPKKNEHTCDLPIFILGLAAPHANARQFRQSGSCDFYCSRGLCVSSGQSNNAKEDVPDVTHTQVDNVFAIEEMR